MLTPIKWTCFILVSLAVLISAMHFIPYSESDFALYHQFKSQSHKGFADIKSPTSSDQHKKGMTKDIWFQKEEGRLQYHIESERSVMHFIRDQRQTLLNEEMIHLRSWIQDKLTQTTQEVRHFRAEKGTFSYNTKTFDAKAVSLLFYRQDGHALSFSPPSTVDVYLQGVAKDVTWMVEKGDTLFTAEHFGAHIDSEVYVP